MPRARLAPSGERRTPSVSRIVEGLLRWYATEARDLPWRRTKDPYAILVSEILLQQTRVETAIPYYERFLRAFPTVAALAEARIDDVLKLWEGLGYYRRAHHLQRAVREMVRLHDAQVPAGLAALRALPGIGPYTAAAVASIAFDVDTPVLDGNVVRVLSRAFRVPGDPARARTRRALEERARALVPPGRAGEMNQALMDLGARICVPRAPRCAACPIAEECAAHDHGDEQRFPERSAKRPAPHRDVVAGVVWARGRSRVLLAQRKVGDLLGGLWEFPGGTVEAGETLAGALQRELDEELGIRVAVGEHLVTVHHAFTHFRMALHVLHCRHTAGRPQTHGCAAFAWVEVERILDYALSVADQKVAAILLAEVRGRREPGR